MATNINRLVAALGLAGQLAGCATSATSLTPPGRGAVVINMPGTRAIVQGPIDVRAYSGFSGGEIYLVNSSIGSDSDCASPSDETAAVSVPADKVISVAVPAGKTACLRTRVDRGYELLWRAEAGRDSDAMIAKTHGRVRT